MPSIMLGGREVNERSRPYVIAEIGVNHEGSLDTAKRLVDLCREGGADAAKFQTYKAELLASRHSPAYWDTALEPTQSQYLLFKKYDAFGPLEYEQLETHCRGVGIQFLSTPFDVGAVHTLDPLVPFFKVASADVTNLPLLRAVARTGKPVVLSTGASSLDEIDHALEALAAAGCPEVALMHCVLSYPTPPEAAHLGMITGLRRRYPDRVIGYSDHTVPDDSMLPLTTACLLGAVIIEKHFTHDKTLPGNDHYHAMDVNDLKVLVARLAVIRQLVGADDDKRPVASEEAARHHARRSVVLSRAVVAGQVLSPDDLVTKRPGAGISPLHWDQLVGRRASRDLPADAVLAWTDLEIL